MTLYTFWSGDTTYITKYKSLKKAQAIGKEIMEHYLEMCKEEGEEPEAHEDYFIPDEVYKERIAWIRSLVKTDADIMILEDDTEEYIMN